MNDRETNDAFSIQITTKQPIQLLRNFVEAEEKLAWKLLMLQNIILKKDDLYRWTWDYHFCDILNIWDQDHFCDILNV